MVIAPEKWRTAGSKQDKASEERTGRLSAQKKLKKKQRANGCEILHVSGEEKGTF